MIRLLRHKTNGTYLLIENRQGKEFRTQYASELEAKQGLKRAKINRNNRERNEVLRELTGTSARAARMDMGL